MASSNPVDATLIVSRISNGEGSAVEQRREHLQPDERRCDAVLPDDGDDQGRRRRHRRQPGVHVVLLQPDRLPALVHAVPRRVLQGDDPGTPDASCRRPPADAPRPEVRRDAGREQRHPARRQRRPDHRGDVPRRQRHLRRLHRLRRARPSLRPRAGRVVQALDGVDAAIASLVKATEEAPRPYKFIVLSDHGQSLGETFLQRYG